MKTAFDNILFRNCHLLAPLTFSVMAALFLGCSERPANKQSSLSPPQKPLHKSETQVFLDNTPVGVAPLPRSSKPYYLDSLLPPASTWTRVRGSRANGQIVFDYEKEKDFQPALYFDPKPTLWVGLFRPDGSLRLRAQHVVRVDFFSQEEPPFRVLVDGKPMPLSLDSISKSFPASSTEKTTTPNTKKEKWGRRPYRPFEKVVGAVTPIQTISNVSIVTSSPSAKTLSNTDLKRCILREKDPAQITITCKHNEKTERFLGVRELRIVTIQ